MLSSISGRHFAGHWPIGNPPVPFVSNAYLDYDMNNGSYVPGASVLTSLGSANISMTLTSPSTVVYTQGPPNYISMGQTAGQYAYCSLPTADSLLANSGRTISGWHRKEYGTFGYMFVYESGSAGRIHTTRSGNDLGYQINYANGSGLSSGFSNVFDDATWNFLTVYASSTATNITLTVWCNGSQRGTITVNGSWSPTPSSFNSLTIEGNTPYRGQWAKYQMYKDITTLDHAAVWAAERAFYGR